MNRSVRPLSRLPQGALRLLAPLASLLLAGCLETREVWVFDDRGGGTYSLAMRWQADLWSRVGAVVGGDVLRRIEGRGFPIRAHQIRDSLAGLDGVEVREVSERDTGGGGRELAVEVAFRRVSDLVRWEVLAGRPMSVRIDEEGSVRMTTKPLVAVPVVDALVDLAKWKASGPPADETSRGDPSPQERLGVRAADADLLETMLRPHLDRLRFRFRVEVPGRVVEVGERRLDADVQSGAVEVSFADLVAGRGRDLVVRWSPRSLDVPPLVEHVPGADRLSQERR